MFSRISEGVTKRIKLANICVDDEELEQIEYGIYMFIADLSKASIILIVALLIGVFKYACLAILVFGVLRGYIGGTHGKTHLSCIITYGIIIFGSIYIGLYIGENYFKYILFPILLLITYKYAPADLPCKPIQSKKQIKNLKFKGTMLVLILFIVSGITPYKISNIITIVTTIAVLMITPFVYKITKNTLSKERMEADYD